MRVHNPPFADQLHPELATLLAAQRAARGFDPAAYATAKAELLNEYLRAHHLKAVVVGVSGGIDSAVVAGLLARAAAAPRSPIERAVAVLLPVHDPAAATGQDTATGRGRQVAATFGLPVAEVDLTGPHAALKAAVDTATAITGGPWAAGQLVSYLRTPALYYVTSLLAQADLAPVVAGTTNRDEGAWLGYFGKASDGLVDVQLISDLHKSEVIALARHLGVPASVLAVAPTGDMFDGRTDETVFGAPYDFVELYLGWLCREQTGRAEVLAGLSQDAAAQFTTLAAHLDKLHRYNAHKYLVASPAVHLDLLPAHVPGGWHTMTWTPPSPTADLTAGPTAEPAFDPAAAAVAPGPAPAGTPSLEQRARFVGEFTLDAAWTTTRPTGAVRPLAQVDPSAGVVPALLTPAEAGALRAQVEHQAWVPVGVNGMRGGFDPDRDQIGSWRASTYDDTLAQVLYTRLRPLLGQLWPADSPWRPVGVNPLLRFIRYDDGGILVPHYDAPYTWHETRTTKLSLVLYLGTDPGTTGGATRFLHDPQAGLPPRERRYEDWDHFAAPADVHVAVHGQAGDALLFAHRLLHDGELVRGGSKFIMRTDVTFERTTPTP